MALPRANLHADLFRDNVLFEGTHLTGLIDFYNACSGPMLYDLAIALNDWCSRENGQLDAVRARALLGAYARAAAVHGCGIEALEHDVAHRLRTLLAVPPDRRRDVRRAGRADSRSRGVRTASGLPFAL